MTGIPKKRKVLVSEAGVASPLGKRSGLATDWIYPSSGTLLPAGHLTVSGAQFKVDSCVIATYHNTSSGTQSLSATLTNGTCMFRGDPSEGFFYSVFNKSRM